MSKLKGAVAVIAGVLIVVALAILPGIFLMAFGEVMKGFGNENK